MSGSGATDVAVERGGAGVEIVKELIDDLGVKSTVEAVGTRESMMQASRSTRPGGHVGCVGLAHGVEPPGEELFRTRTHLHGGPTPVSRFLPNLIELITPREVNPGRAFDSEIPLAKAPEVYAAMGGRRAINVLPRP